MGTAGLLEPPDGHVCEEFQDIPPGDPKHDEADYECVYCFAQFDEDGDLLVEGTDPE